MLKITASHLHDIRRHGEEIVSGGVLWHPDRHIRRRRTNRAVNCPLSERRHRVTPRTRYRIDPREVIRAQRDVRERGS